MMALRYYVPMANDAAKMIVDLRWEETSGVDHPANQTEGWVVMKNAEENDDETVDLDAMIKAEAEVIKGFEDAVAALQGLDLKDAPPAVQAAIKVLVDYLQGYGYGYKPPEGAGYPAPAAGAAADDKGYPKPRPALLRIAQKILDRLTRAGKADEVRDDDDGEDKEMVALKAAWPEFCDEVAKAVTAKDVDAAIKAIMQLKAKVTG
jgi:hypothetical protein